MLKFKIIQVIHIHVVYTFVLRHEQEKERNNKRDRLDDKWFFNTQKLENVKGHKTIYAKSVQDLYLCCFLIRSKHLWVN